MNLFDVNVSTKDPAFNAGYKWVDHLVSKADGVNGPAPYWHGWAVRYSFWAGVLWERARDKEKTPE